MSQSEFYMAINALDYIVTRDALSLEKVLSVASQKPNSPQKLTQNGSKT